jgi:hypothetical protein
MHKAISFSSPVPFAQHCFQCSVPPFTLKQRTVWNGTLRSGPSNRFQVLSKSNNSMRPDAYKQAASRRYQAKQRVPGNSGAGKSTQSRPETPPTPETPETPATPQRSSENFSRRKVENNEWRYQQEGTGSRNTTSTLSLSLGTRLTCHMVIFRTE